MKKLFKRIVSTIVTTVVLASSSIVFTAAPASAAGITVNGGGWKEEVYAEWLPVDGAAKYEAYVKASTDSNYTQVDDELIRQYPTYWRVDAVGLKAGNYDLKVVAKDKNGAEISSSEKKNIAVTSYERSGFAFTSQSTLKTGSGAYNDDGTLKDDAVVIYVTDDNAKTVTADIKYDKTLTTFTGLQSIMNALEKGTETRPIDVRIIGTIKDSSMDSFLSEEGLQVKGKKAYSNLNLTIEGIGNDAAISGFGLLLRNAGNVELRNFAVMLCMDDCVSIDTGNCNLWVHNMDFFYGKTGGDSDQAKGDGTVDLKGASTYLTISENHFWDSGKSSLCGMKSDCYTDYYVTYSKNWFDHSDSRHPRIRGGNIHVYNNYYDGNAKYGVGVTTGGSAFVENNYFRNCKDPMLISQQGTDAKGTGTFSGEDGGYIKEYGNILVGTYYFIPGEDAYCATSRDEKVPDTYVATAVNDGVRYSNFDTDSSIMYSYTPIEAKDVPTYVVSNAGRLNHGDFNWDFENLTEDTNYAVISELKTALQNYKSNLVSVGGTVTTTSTSTTPCSLIGTDGNTVSYQPEEKLTSLKLPTETDEDGNKATGGTGGQTSYDLYVKASDLDGSVVSGTQEVKGTSGSVTVIASTDKPVTLDKSKGIMLGGSGSKTVRTIKFTAEKKGTFYISGASTSSDVRTLAIVNEDGTEVATVTTDTTGKLTLDAGTYYVYSKNKGINVSLIAMVYDDNGDNGDAGEDNGDDEPTLPYAYGDASGDGSLTANDAAVILQKVLDSKFVMGIEEKVTDEATVKTIVDVDGNGTITSNDAAVVLQKVLDNSYTMPCEK